MEDWYSNPGWAPAPPPHYGRIGPDLGGGDLAQRYFGTPTGNSELFYQSADGMPFAWSRYAAGESNPDSFYRRWLDNQQDEVRSGFINQSVNDPYLQYTDYIAQQAPGLAQRYLALPGWQQGKGAPAGFAGRRM